MKKTSSFKWHQYFHLHILHTCHKIVPPWFPLKHVIKTSNHKLSYNLRMLPYPTTNFGVSDPGGGSTGNFWTQPKIVARPAQLQKNIALAFWNAAWLQIPYWVHFTFEVQNHIYICSLPLRKQMIDWDFIIKVKPSIDMEIQNITKPSLALRL